MWVIIVLILQKRLQSLIYITYRIVSDSKKTTIFGSLLGGLMSFYATVKFPKTFRKTGMFSSVFSTNKEIFSSLAYIFLFIIWLFKKKIMREILIQQSILKKIAFVFLSILNF